MAENYMNLIYFKFWQLKTAVLYLRHGVGVSIRGSHPRDPGSIPGAGMYFWILAFISIIYDLYVIGKFINTPTMWYFKNNIAHSIMQLVTEACLYLEVNRRAVFGVRLHLLITYIQILWDSETGKYTFLTAGPYL